MENSELEGYLVWNLTNYNEGFEMLGVYTTLDKAKKAYKSEMQSRYGTTDEDMLVELWDNSDTGCCDSWRITPIRIQS